MSELGDINKTDMLNEVMRRWNVYLGRYDTFDPPMDWSPSRCMKHWAKVVSTVTKTQVFPNQLNSAVVMSALVSATVDDIEAAIVAAPVPWDNGLEPYNGLIDNFPTIPDGPTAIYDIPALVLADRAGHLDVTDLPRHVIEQVRNYRLNFMSGAYTPIDLTEM